jgi:hypothetical protein
MLLIHRYTACMLLIHHSLIWPDVGPQDSRQGRTGPTGRMVPPDASNPGPSACSGHMSGRLSVTNTKPTAERTCALSATAQLTTLDYEIILH